MNKINAAITCVHGVVPEKILSNKDLEKMVDTNDEWITSRTGIKERRIVANGETLSDLGSEVVKSIIGVSNDLHNKILIYNALKTDFRKVKISRNSKCINSFIFNQINYFLF